MTASTRNVTTDRAGAPLSSVKSPAARFPVLLALVTLLPAVIPAGRAAVEPGALEEARRLFAAGKPAEAQQAFEKLAAAEPGNPDVNHHLGQLANRRDDPEKAIRYFEQAIAAEPSAGRHHHGLGDAFGRSAQKAGILSKFGLAKKCLAEYQRAVELEPDNVEFRLSLFEYYRQAPGIAGGGIDKAMVQAEAIKRLDAARGRIALATLYVGEKDFEKAFGLFEDVLKANPDDYGALYQVGRLAALSGQSLDRGIASLRRCLELPPPTSPTIPGHAAAHWRLGNLLEKKSDVAGARAAYTAAVALDPKFTPAADALKKLK